MKDMTEGRPFGLLIRFFVPLFLGNLFQQLYSMVDSVIVGKFVGVNALAGVGSTGSFNFLILGFVMGSCAGFGIMVGQSFGCRDYRKMREYIANSFWLSGVIVAVLTPVTVMFCGQILKMMKTPENIYQDAYDYIIVILAGIGAMMLYNITASILRAIGDSKTPLFALIFASLLNIVLDLVFILVFHMGAMGAGLATVISQGISGIVCLIYMFRRYEILRIQKEEWRFSGYKSKNLMIQGLPMALQFSITAVGCMVLQIAVNGLGSIYVAAMTAGNKISSILTMAFENLGIALTTYCSQNMGAGKYKRIRDGIRVTFFTEMAMCAVGILLVFTCGSYMSLLFIDASETEIIHQVMVFLKLNAVMYPFIGILFSFRYSLQGMGYSFVAMFAGVFEMAGRILVAVALTGLMGFAGASLGNGIAWLLADIFLVAEYFHITKKNGFYLE